MTAFLASTRDLYEANLAVAGGADWIDLKNPAAGALGAVEHGVARQVRNWLETRDFTIPVSATIGDCWNEPWTMPTRVERLHRTGIPYAKIGLYAAAPNPEMLESIRTCCTLGPRIILVCFAEAPPSTEEVATYAECGIAGIMLDTAEKTGHKLTHLMDTSAIAAFVDAARRHDLLCGLAGSLGLDDIDALVVIGPDYLGFRGALCEHAIREAGLSSRAVEAVRDRLDRAISATAGREALPAAGFQ